MARMSMTVSYPYTPPLPHSQTIETDPSDALRVLRIRPIHQHPPPPHGEFTMLLPAPTLILQGIVALTRATSC